MALKSWLLTLEDYHFLLKARNLDDFLEYLQTTVYGTALTGWDWHKPEMEGEFSRRLYGELALAFHKVSRGLKKREALFLGVLARRLEVENLKLVLRGLHQELPAAQTARMLLPLDQISSLNFQELLNQGTIKALMNFLARTPWGLPLARGFPRYFRERSLFPLEMSLDLWVFDSLRQGLTHLANRDRRLGGKLLDTLADITNLIWIGRFKEVYGLPGEEFYQYLLEAGIFREPRRRRQLVFAPDLKEMLARLPPRPYGALLGGAGYPAVMEERLSRYWIKTLDRVLARPPFQIGLPVAYLFLKEVEIRHLITLMTGILLKVPHEQLSTSTLRGVGAGYV